VKDIACILEYTWNPENPFLKNKLAKKQLTPQKLNGHLDRLNRLNSLKEKIRYINDTILRQPSEGKNGKLLQKMLDLAAYYEGNLSDFHKYLILGSAGDAYEHQTEKVALMTLHASKGLEFQCVFIAGCEDGLIPYSLFKNQETNRDEEKRLLYVGMTRAKSYLYLTHAGQRFIMGTEKTMQRSPFLNRIEKSLLR
jgi:superfamily I DNA/RNA helicase